MSDKKKGSKKAATKKDGTPRKTRVPMRSRKESVAGHFADKLRAYSKQANDVMAKVEKFPGVSEANSAQEVIDVLEKLAAENFKPARGKGGNRGPSFTVGQAVTLSENARNLIKTQAADIDSLDLFVGVNYDGGKQVPIRAGGFGLEARWIGFVWKKDVAAKVSE